MHPPVWHLDRTLNKENKKKQAGAAAKDMSALPMPKGSAGDVVKGAAFYMQNCATCHGASGDGRGPRAYSINPKPQNTRYHTAANGWPNHERYAAAFPFATGTVPLDTPWERLAPQPAAGKRFLAACASCHDRARVNQEGASWELRPLSYPRNQFSPGAYPSWTP